jgi:hypothetical protein
MLVVDLLQEAMDKATKKQQQGGATEDGGVRQLADSLAKKLKKGG